MPSPTTRPSQDAPAPASGAIASNDAANYDFGGYMRAVYVSNNHQSATVRLLCLVNRGSGTGTEASTTDYELVIPAGETRDLCNNGQRHCKTCSIWIDGTLVTGDVTVKTLSAV